MHELNQFCNTYLPEYFVSKFKAHKLKPHFFQYKNAGNVFEVTGNILSLIDRLLSANPQLAATSIIDKYFIFEIVEFKKYRNEIIQEEKCQARKTVRKILKSMDENARMCFQIFMRLAYLYFDSREIKNESPKLKKQNEQKEQKGIDYEDQVVCFYYDIKILTMTQDDSFIPMAFMEYVIRILLDLNPNHKFLGLIIELLDKFQFSEKYREIILQKIATLKTNHHLNERTASRQNKSQPKNNNAKGSVSVLESKNQNISLERVQNNESTPIKGKSGSKSEQNTHETSQKKQNITQKYEQDPKTLQQLKTTLKLHKKMTTKSRQYKQRTLYSRKKYLMPKKVQTINDQNSSVGSNHNNNEELFIIDINRSYSARCLDIHFNEDEDFLAGATPKPRKKVKMEKTYTGTFDQKGNFVQGF